MILFKSWMMRCLENLGPPCRIIDGRNQDRVSKVSEQRILATCQACHPKANANFVKFQPHANKHDKESGLILYYTTKFMQLLLAGVFLAFGLHTILWLYRSLVEMKARRSRTTPKTEIH